MPQKLEALAAARCTQNGTKILRPQTRAQLCLKQDKDSRPKLAMIDQNSKTMIKLDNSKKPVPPSKEPTRVSTNVSKEGRTFEIKRPNHTSSFGCSLTTTYKRSKLKQAAGESRLKQPKIFVKDSENTEVELASLGPDCKPDFNSTLQLDQYVANSPDMKDSDDPQQCTTYITSIYQSLLHAENQHHFRIRRDLLSRQTDVNANHRRVLVNWMVEVNIKFGLSSDTLHISVDILDCCLQKMPIVKKKLQLVGITAMFIAAKYEDVHHPSILDFAYISSGLYTTAQICQMEISVLCTLGYQLGKPTPLTFLRRYSKLMTTTTYVHNLAKYFVEACYLSTECRTLLPSQQAVGALLLAAAVAQRNSKQLWTPVMQKYTWYSKSRAGTFMSEVARQMKSYFQLVSSGRLNCMAVKEKYSKGGSFKVAASPWLQDSINVFARDSSSAYHSSGQKIGTVDTL